VKWQVGYVECDSVTTAVAAIRTSLILTCISHDGNRMWNWTWTLSCVYKLEDHRPMTDCCNVVHSITLNHAANFYSKPATTTETELVDCINYGSQVWGLYEVWTQAQPKQSTWTKEACFGCVVATFSVCKYNLYHILNHEVLFGGMYRNQARSMILEILRM
jgi:hypothetical protein